MSRVLLGDKVFPWIAVVVLAMIAIDIMLIRWIF